MPPLRFPDCYDLRKEAPLSKDLTSKVVEQQLAKIGRIDQQLRQVEKLQLASTAMDASHSARRTFALILGIPLGITAFVYIGFLWNAMNGTGLYIGITCATILWLIVRHVIGLPLSDAQAIHLRVRHLAKERGRMQESLRKYVEENATPEDAVAAAGAGTERGSTKEEVAAG